MKKTTLSIVSIVAFNGLAYAGGNMTPIETAVETPMVIDIVTGACHASYIF